MTSSLLGPALELDSFAGLIYSSPLPAFLDPGRAKRNNERSVCPAFRPPKALPPMTTRRAGLWLIGACGGVASTAALGLAALSHDLTDSTSLVTALPLFSGVDLDPPAAFVVGGHEVRRASFLQTVRELHQRSNVFDA